MAFSAKGQAVAQSYTDAIRSYNVAANGAVTVVFNQGEGLTFSDWADMHDQTKDADTDPDTCRKKILKMALAKDPDPAAALESMRNKPVTFDMADDTPVSVGDAAPETP